MSLDRDKIFETSFSFPQERNILSPILALVIFDISSKASSLKNLPIGPLPVNFPFFSKVKYAKPDAPWSFAHLSIESKKLLGLVFVFLVIIHLTLHPSLTSFLKYQILHLLD